MSNRRGKGIPPKRYGTPTVEAEPQAIDPASGFKVPLRRLVRQWDNQLIFDRFVDKRNPQDFVRGIKDNMALPYSRPEPHTQYIAGNIIWQTPDAITVPILVQDGGSMNEQQDGPILAQETQPIPLGPQIFMTTQIGEVLLEQGEVPTL